MLIKAAKDPIQQNQHEIQRRKIRSELGGPAWPSRLPCPSLLGLGPASIGIITFVIPGHIVGMPILNAEFGSLYVHI